MRPTDVNPNVPADLSNVVERMLRKNPDQRYQNLAELRADLDEVRERFAGAAQRTEVLCDRVLQPWAVRPVTRKAGIRVI